MRTDSSLDCVQRHLQAQQQLEKSPRVEVPVDQRPTAVREQVMKPVKPPRDGVFKEILVALDESNQAGWAVDLAARLARAHGARLTLLHVVIIPPLRPEFAYIEPTEPGGCFRESERLLDQGKAHIGDAVEVETALREGDPATEIVHAAQKLGADLIVMGTHGRGPIGRVVLGSVANAVMRKSTCPVLTVSHAPAVDPDPLAAATPTTTAAP
jgi:nucleotide-binding universal stress UspA family protein